MHTAGEPANANVNAHGHDHDHGARGLGLEIQITLHSTTPSANYCYIAALHRKIVLDVYTHNKAQETIDRHGIHWATKE